ncbi:NAD-dependent epimerase/dehydratase family protein [Streptomyces avicenniae]|uniref:NAD-dependent epimerase/dehydratase family protein n=1 Tax=Streptomyces avicenniae TaxID=500153 RepID=UPI00069BCCA1|nr:NAD-dependent epimerase/dehydratase family protein [Streptomyces avicenniae]
MKVAVFGASGMVGQGVLRACLLDEAVTEVVAVVRRPLGAPHPKLREIVHTDFTDLSAVADALGAPDACFYCLGISSAGLAEAEYTVITHDYTLAAAETLLARNPALTFVYVSGSGADSTESGSTMWARVRGRTENALLALSPRARVIRPGYIRPRHGARSRTRSYRVLYATTSWLYPLFHRLLPRHTTTTDTLGRAMLALARTTDEDLPRILTSEHVNRLGA